MVTNGYCTESELQQAIGRAVDMDDPNYALIQDCINRASRMIDTKTGRIYYQKTVSNERIDQYDISVSGLYVDEQNIMLPCPIISITSIIQDGITLIEDDDFIVYSDRVVNDFGWTTERKGVSFSGVIGYSSTPEYVKNWCIQIASVLSGLATFSVTDSDGSTYTRDKTEIPSWVEKEMRQNRRCLI